MQSCYSHNRLSDALDKIDAFVRLLGYLQDVGSPEERQAHANVEGYIIEVLMHETYFAKRAADLSWEQFKAANDMPETTGQH